MPSVQDHAQHRYNQDHEAKNRSKNNNKDNQSKPKEQIKQYISPLNYSATALAYREVDEQIEKRLPNVHPQLKPLVSTMRTEFIPSTFLKLFFRKPNRDNVGYVIGAYKAAMESIANDTSLTDQQLKTASETTETFMVKRNQLTSASDEQKQKIAYMHMYYAVFFYRARELALNKGDKKMLDTVRMIAKQSLDNMPYGKG
jgi:hypothetical protein